MMTEKTNLREADAIVEIEGILAEKNLEIVQVEGKNVIKGDLVIQTDVHNFATVNIYINQITKSNTENKAYKGIVTVMENYKSIAEVGREEADRVRVTKGKLSPNTYFDTEGNQHDSIRYQTNFVSRVKEGEETNPKATFEVELFIQSIIPEVVTGGEDAGEETGRLKLRGYMPTYNSIEPLELIVPVSYTDEDGEEIEVASMFETAFEAGQTARFYGELINEKITVTDTIPVAFGKPRSKTKTSYVNELLITGASEAYDEERAYDPDTIQKALVDREAILEEKKNKAMSGSNKTGNKPSGAASGRKLPTGVTGAKPKFSM